MQHDYEIAHVLTHYEKSERMMTYKNVYTSYI